jgi:hypothetical protein
MEQTCLNEPEHVVTVHVKYGEVEQTFKGDVNVVWASINRFFSEFMPAFDTARKITLTVDLTELIDDFKDIIAIAPEGPELISEEKLTDSEALKLYLLSCYIGYRLGKLPREALTKEELQTKLGKNMKIVATRLGELVKQGDVVKTEQGSYRISTKAVRQLQDKKTSWKTV